MRSALFGGGTQATSLIQHVFVGDGPTGQGTVLANRNSFPLIRSVLNALAIPAGVSDGHENHFHVDFRTPTRLPIPQNLLVDASENREASASALSVDDVESFIEQAQVELGIERGDEAVFTLDMPDLPQHYTSAVIAQANQAQNAIRNKERAMGVCFGAYNPPGQEYPTMLSPASVAADYFVLYEKREADPFKPPSGNVELVEQPKHGKVVYSKYHDGLLYPEYIPLPSYVGDEKIVFRVNVDGVTVKVVYLLKVTREIVGGQLTNEYFCKKDFWKISLPNPPTDTSTIQSLLSFTGITSATKIEVSNLANGAVGITQGTTITLSPNAAGHNWFIDATPWFNVSVQPPHL